jgi:hypothetical protein
VSRSRIFQLKSLNETDLRRVVEQALADGDRGYGNLNVQLETAALDHWVNIANGDARTLPLCVKGSDRGRSPLSEAFGHPCRTARRSCHGLSGDGLI